MRESPTRAAAAERAVVVLMKEGNMHKETRPMVSITRKTGLDCMLITNHVNYRRGQG